MSRGDYLLPVVTSTGVEVGRCKYCGDRIYWVIVASRGPGCPARSLPFTSRPIPERTERNDETGVVVEYWPSRVLHNATCTGDRPKPKRKPRLQRSSPPASFFQKRLI